MHERASGDSDENVLNVNLTLINLINFLIFGRLNNTILLFEKYTPCLNVVCLLKGGCL